MYREDLGVERSTPHTLVRWKGSACSFGSSVLGQMARHAPNVGIIMWRREVTSADKIRHLWNNADSDGRFAFLSAGGEGSRVL